MPVNNAFYETAGRTWWADDASFAYTSLRFCVNPVRYGYFSRTLRSQSKTSGRVLDVGCGGGYLSEAFARDGFEVAGIDPAAASIEAASAHAAREGLRIDYRVGRGESLPFPDDFFDIIACCDVLEHVDDVEQVIGEVSRTLRPGGLFLFDTVNRTRKSRFALITVWQDWNVLGLSDEDRDTGLHSWDKFITPPELAASLSRHALVVADVRGLSAKRNPLSLARAFVGIRRGRIRNEALVPALGFHESDDLSVSYMGWARKTTGEPQARRNHA